MKAKSAIYYLTILTLILVPLVLIYYIFVNTVLAKNVLPNIKLNSVDISYSNQAELRAKVENEALNILPERTNVKFEDTDMSFATKDLNVKVDTYDLINYGKGNDLLKVVSDGLSLLRGVDVNVTYDVNINNLITLVGLSFNAPDSSSLVDSVYKCVNNRYSFNSLNTTKLKSDLINAIRTNTTFNFELSNYLIDAGEQITYKGCLKYKNEWPKIQKNLLTKIEVDSSTEDLIQLVEVNGNAQWRIKDGQILSDLLNKYKQSSDISPDEGDYEVVNNKKIYVYKQPIDGINLDLTASTISIDSWLKSNNLELDPLVYNKIPTKLAGYNLPILDFTQNMGEGHTRIELIRDGYPNASVPFTIFGLDEIEKDVVMPNEEFSYIKAIDPQPNGTTKSGRPIMGGICNSTTTLFRSVLQAGLQVTDRSYHAYYVPSYEWGYPMNIVDAAYYTSPVVDFKFKNNSDFPILIKVEYAKDAEYQYNTVKILSSSQSKKRDVVLSNWKKWDNFSATNFKGSFDRTVSVDGVVLFTDNFYSHYL